MSESVNKKNVIYVGGLDENVTEEILRGAFIPFGQITEINLPIDYKTQKSKGFGFVEFELVEDAADALDNMNESEIFGKPIICSIAKPIKNLNKALWSTDEYHLEQIKANEGESNEGESKDEE